MDQLNKLFAIKLMVLDLNFSDTYKANLLAEVQSMINAERERITGAYANNIDHLDAFINESNQ